MMIIKNCVSTAIDFVLLAGVLNSTIALLVSSPTYYSSTLPVLYVLTLVFSSEVSCVSPANSTVKPVPSTNLTV